jgi:hypothetical protein
VNGQKVVLARLVVAVAVVAALIGCAGSQQAARSAGTGAAGKGPAAWVEALFRDAPRLPDGSVRLRLPEGSARVARAQDIRVPASGVDGFKNRAHVAASDLQRRYLDGESPDESTAYITAACHIKDLVEVVDQPTLVERARSAILNFGCDATRSQRVAGLAAELRAAETGRDFALLIAVFAICESD